MILLTEVAVDITENKRGLARLSDGITRQITPSYTNDALLGNAIQENVMYIQRLLKVKTLCIDSGSIELGGLCVRKSVTEMNG